MNRLGLKIGCFLISILIWIQVSYNHRIEQTLLLPVRFVNLAPGLTVAGNDLPDAVRVRVRGSKLRLMAHRYLNRRVGRVEVDLAGVEPGPPIHDEITVADVRSQLDVLAVTPPVRLRLRVDRERSRVLPVEPVLSGEPPPGRQLAGPARVEPDSVVVTGPERLMGYDRVQTAPVDLSRLRETTTVARPLVLPHPSLIGLKDEVEVTVPIAAAVSRRFSHLPVVPLVDAGQGEVTVTPPLAEVTVSGVADSVAALLPARIAVTLPLSGLEPGSHRVPGQVVLPDAFRLVELQPEAFTVLVGAARAGVAP